MISHLGLGLGLSGIYHFYSVNCLCFFFLKKSSGVVSIKTEVGTAPLFKVSGLGGGVRPVRGQLNKRGQLKSPTAPSKLAFPSASHS